MHAAAVLLILRRMRAPLLTLIMVYAVTIVGLVLIPGVDPDGGPARLSIFHAFYIMTYTATTTGFGELPHPFSDGQRLWVTLSMYTSIVAWLYALGALIALLRDPTFKRVFAENRFAAAVARLDDRFYIVCGYGDAGDAAVQALTTHIFSAVVLERSEERIRGRVLEDMRRPVVALAADAALPANLLLAGLRRPRCAGVIALCNSDQVNLQIAISAKLLNPDGLVIARAQTPDMQANMESFNTDLVINPFEAFAERLTLALKAPHLHQLYDWLTAPTGAPLPALIDPPRGGWVLCGFGRFGKALASYLEREGIVTVIVEEDPERAQAPEDAIAGRGTEAVTLRQARVQQAAGIVAGTDDDANNLSILVTARELNPDLFTVVRQNRRENDAVFEAARPDLIMQRARAIAQRIIASVSTPLLADFLRHARGQSNDWARDLLARLRPLLGERAPEVWTIDVTADGAAAVRDAIARGERVRLGDLCADPRDRAQRLPLLPLCLRRDGQLQPLPPENLALGIDDCLLLCGRREAARLLTWTLFNANVLDYVRYGEERPNGYLWRWLRGAR